MTSAVISAVLGVLTLVSVVASAVAVARASLAKSTIETLKESNAALVEQAGIQGAEISRLTRRLTVLEDENQILRTLASGAAAVGNLSSALGISEEARRAEHHDILAAVETWQALGVEHHDEVMAMIRATSHTHAGQR